MDFSALKNRSGKSSLEKLTQELSKLNTQSDSKGGDDRFWYPAVDKAGNGYAVIRFLPAPGDEDVPFVRMFEHGFKGPTGVWYIENSLTTIGKQDPVGELNSKLWNESTDDNSPGRKQARAQKRRLNYICNIYIVQDQANPENNGKVKLFKFGKKIFDKLQEAMNPTAPDETKINPFDFWQGANFKLKAHLESGYVSYEKSAFQTPSEVFDGDDKRLEVLWKSQHALVPFVAPDQFKSYEELKGRMDQVLKGGNEGSATRAEEAEPEDFRSKMKASTAAVVSEEKPAKKAPAKAAKTEDDDEDAFAYFKKLADDDE
jgi:hypothetical protein